MKALGFQQISERRKPAAFSTSLLLSLLLLAGFGAPAFAQTDGSVELEATLLNYGGSGAKHWTVAWVTTGSGAFIKTLWIQGNKNNFWSSHWNNHCGKWYSTRSGSQALDGYTSATATSYSGVNSPIRPSWDCRNASGQLVPDGPYRFWVQYAEDGGQGPYTTSGLLWTKGPAAGNSTYPNQGSNFANLKVVWNPVLPPEPPVITSVRLLGSDLILEGTGDAGLTYDVLTSNDILLPVAGWTAIGSSQISGAGQFSYTNNVDLGASGLFYRLRIPTP